MPSATGQRTEEHDLVAGSAAAARTIVGAGKGRRTSHTSGFVRRAVEQISPPTVGMPIELP